MARYALTTSNFARDENIMYESVFTTLRAHHPSLNDCKIEHIWRTRSQTVTGDLLLITIDV